MMTNYTPKKITPVEQAYIFRSFNKIRKDNDLPELTESEMLLYLSRYFKNNWYLLRDKITKNNARSVIVKEKKRIERRNLHEQRRAEKLLKHEETKSIQETIEIKRESEDRICASITKIEEGFVYFITNQSFPGWVKIGSTINLKDRLAVYQTCDPYQKFIIRHSKYYTDRKSAEIKIHKLLDIHRGQGEWFKINYKKAIKLVEKSDI